MLTGVGPGKATITATWEGIEGTAAVTVAGQVVSVTLVAERTTIVVGDEEYWRADARDAAGTLLARSEPIWSSSDPRTVFAFADRRVVGVTPGTAHIPATLKGVTGSAEATVLRPLNLSGAWTMEEHYDSDYGTIACSPGGPVRLDQEHGRRRSRGSTREAPAVR